MSRHQQAAVATSVCLAIGLIAAVAYMSLSPRENEPLLAWDDTAVVARGEAIYAAQCATCHGANGQGQSASDSIASSAPLAPPHDGSGHTWQHPDFALIQLTKAGEADASCKTLDKDTMPQFEEVLSDREIVDVLSYIKSKWPADIRAEHDAVNHLYRGQNAAVRDLLDLADS